MTKNGINRRTLIKSAGVGLAATTLAAPSVWGQGKKTLRFLNTETSIDSIRALKVACAEYEQQRPAWKRASAAYADAGHQ